MSDLPFYAADMIGYRAWMISVRKATPWARSLLPVGLVGTGISAWHPCVNEATCHVLPWINMPAHSSPNNDCQCGFWSYYSPWQAHAWPDHLDTPRPSMFVTGVVRVSGRVALWDDGFRSSEAEILALAPPRYSSLRIHGVGPKCPVTNIDLTPLHKIAFAYQVDAYDTFAAMVRDYPPTNTAPHIEQEATP